MRRGGGRELVLLRVMTVSARQILLYETHVCASHWLSAPHRLLEICVYKHRHRSPVTAHTRTAHLLPRPRRPGNSHARLRHAARKERRCRVCRHSPNSHSTTGRLSSLWSSAQGGFRRQPAGEQTSVVYRVASRKLLRAQQHGAGQQPLARIRLAKADGFVSDAATEPALLSGACSPT